MPRAGLQRVSGDVSLAGEDTRGLQREVGWPSSMHRRQWRCLLHLAARPLVGGVGIRSVGSEGPEGVGGRWIVRGMVGSGKGLREEEAIGLVRVGVGNREWGQ